MKLKNRKSLTKRVRVTGSKKISIRTGGQGHFNSRESGKVAINKRRDKILSSVNKEHVKRRMPYR